MYLSAHHPTPTHHLTPYPADRHQKQIAEALAHPRTRVLPSAAAAAEFVAAHNEALDAFLMARGSVAVRGS